MCFDRRAGGHRSPSPATANSGAVAPSLRSVRPHHPSFTVAPYPLAVRHEARLHGEARNRVKKKVPALFFSQLPSVMVFVYIYIYTHF